MKKFLKDVKYFFKEDPAFILACLFFLLLVSVLVYLFVTNPVGTLNGVINGIMWYLIWSKIHK